MPKNMHLKRLLTPIELQESEIGVIAIRGGRTLHLTPAFCREERFDMEFDKIQVFYSPSNKAILISKGNEGYSLARTSIVTRKGFLQNLGFEDGYDFVPLKIEFQNRIYYAFSSDHNKDLYAASWPDVIRYKHIAYDVWDKTLEYVSIKYQGNNNVYLSLPKRFLGNYDLEITPDSPKIWMEGKTLCFSFFEQPGKWNFMNTIPILHLTQDMALMPRVGKHFPRIVERDGQSIFQVDDLTSEHYQDESPRQESSSSACSEIAFS